MAVTYTVASFNISNTIGVDVTNTFPVYGIPGSAASGTALSYPEFNNPTFAVGTHVLGGGNSEYVLAMVGTAGSISRYDLVCIDNTMTATQASSTSASVATMLGWLQGYITGSGSTAGVSQSLGSGTVYFAWIALRGDQLKGNTNAAVAASNTTWYIGTAPGTIGTASASGAQILGIGNVASVTAATVMSFIATFPRLNSF